MYVRNIPMTKDKEAPKNSYLFAVVPANNKIVLDLQHRRPVVDPRAEGNSSK